MSRPLQDKQIWFHERLERARGRYVCMTEARIYGASLVGIVW
jgi:hypothetical protein